MARVQTSGDVTRGGVGTMTGPNRRLRPDQVPPATPDPRRGRPAPAQAQAPAQAPPRRPDAPRPASRPGRVPTQAAPAQAAPARPGAGPRAGTAVPLLSGAGLLGIGRGAVADPARPAVAPPARPGRRADAPAPWRVPPGPRTTGPQPALAPAEAPATGPATAAQPRTARHRMPFVLLLCGLLGGALISALVISTTLAEGSFQITKLQHSTSSLARQRQVLQEKVAEAEAPATIEVKAAKLGLRRNAELWFVDLRSGKTANDGPTFPGAEAAPGFAP